MDTDKFRIKSWSQVHVQGRGSAMPLVPGRRVLAKFVNEFVVFFVHYCDHIRVGMMQDCTLFYLNCYCLYLQCTGMYRLTFSHWCLEKCAKCSNHSINVTLAL